MKLSMDHVPPLQFYPKQMRRGIKGQLLKLPTHKGCNSSFQKDEEYFVHTYLPHVDRNSASGSQLIADIKRRSAGQQSQILIQMIQKEFSNVTPNNVLLPAGIFIHNINAPRVDRVLRKVLQGLYYHEERKFLPYDTLMWIQLYEKPEDMPPHFYKVFCKTGHCRGVYPKFFSYRYKSLKYYSYWSMLFWESLLFCMILKSDTTK
jgi:hypothetical protein